MPKGRPSDCPQKLTVGEGRIVAHRPPTLVRDGCDLGDALRGQHTVSVKTERGSVVDACQRHPGPDVLLRNGQRDDLVRARVVAELILPLLHAQDDLLAVEILLGNHRMVTLGGPQCGLGLEGDGKRVGARLVQKGAWPGNAARRLRGGERQRLRGGPTQRDSNCGIGHVTPKDRGGHAGIVRGGGQPRDLRRNALALGDGDILGERQNRRLDVGEVEHLVGNGFQTRGVLGHPMADKTGTDGAVVQGDEGGARIDRCDDDLV